MVGDPFEDGHEVPGGFVVVVEVGVGGHVAEFVAEGDLAEDIEGKELGDVREVERAAIVGLDEGDEFEDPIVDIGFESVNFSAGVLLHTGISVSVIWGDTQDGEGGISYSSYHLGPHFCVLLLIAFRHDVVQSGIHLHAVVPGSSCPS